MGEYGSIKVVKGAAGFGGPLVITPTEQKHKVLYVTAGGTKPAIIDKIVELSGMEPVNGFKDTIKDEEIAVAVVDCGGNLRCGLYPQKGIPTINIVATGKSGPLAQYITENIYVSAVGVDQIFAYGNNVDDGKNSSVNKTTNFEKSKQGKWVTKIGIGAGRIIGTFNQAARKTTNTMLTTVIPFIGFISLMVALIQGTGIGNVVANLLSPLAGNILGLVIVVFICSLPFLSPLLGPGAVIAQVVGTLIGVEIGLGHIPVQLALPALFAINNQCGCDFIPVGLGLEEAESETVEIGIPAILYSRIITGIPRVLVAWLFSFGLYAGM